MTQQLDLILEFRQNFNDLQEIVSDYLISYIKDVISGRSGVKSREFYDFIEPFIADIDYDDNASLLSKLKIYCDKISQIYNLDGAESIDEVPVEIDEDLQRQLDNVNSMSVAAQLTMPPKKTDIAMLQSRERNVAEMTPLEKKKLLKAEARLQKKQENRNGFADYQAYVDLKSDKTDYVKFNTSIDPELSKGKSRDIQIDNFDISFGGKVIMKNASLNLSFGRRYGLVGRNGVGKSTLLRFISRRDIHSANKNAIPEYIRILHVEQEIEGTDQIVLESVLESDVYLTNLLKEEAALQDKLKKTSVDNKVESDKISDSLKDVWNKMQAIEADKARSRASVILAGLGFSQDAQLRATKTFSGGWRMRIALARALFCKPDVLFLDEPSNHLDFPAVLWLENYLCEWPNTLVVVSHDRDLLDTVSTDIIHLHSYRLDSYRGNYTQFLATRDERRKNQQREYEAQLQQRQHLQDFIDRWRYNAKRAAQAQARIKILEKLPDLKPLEDDGIDEGDLKIRWPDPEDKLSTPILLAQDVSFWYDNSNGQQGKPLLDNVSFSVNLSSRIAIVGANGAGKTTLLKLLLGNLEPKKGIIQRNPRLKIAYFAQHHVDALEADHDSMLMSSVQFLSSKYPGKSEEELRALLGRFGLTGTTALQPIRTLSGGQRNRVVFALMAATNPHILICDEITNNLDIVTVGSLVKALNPTNGFKGGVVVVSHDARFVDQVADELWIVEDGQVKLYKPKNASSPEEESMEGKSGIMEYKQRILSQIQQK